MLTQHLAIVPEADGLNDSDLARVSAAIQKQVTRDLSPVWSLQATVDVFPRLSDVPVGYWPVLISPDAPEEGAVYLDERGQPYGRVRGSRGSLSWSVWASRTCLEMLVNPYGDRTITASSVRSDQGLVEVWLDVWGPCADEANTYTVNDIPVADFCTPAYFGQSAGGGIERCSFRGAVASPLLVPRGGHLAWYDPVSHAYWLRQYWSDNPIDLQWEAAEGRGSLREWIRSVRSHRSVPSPRGAQDFIASRSRRPLTQVASEVRAERLRALLFAQGFVERPPTRGTTPVVQHADREPASPFDSTDEAELKSEEMTLTVESDEVVEDKAATASSISEAESAHAVSSSASRPAVNESQAQTSEMPQSPVSPSAPSPHATLAPIAVPAPLNAPPAKHGMSLLLGATAGAALVVLLWSQQNSVARSAASRAPDSNRAPAKVAPVAAPAETVTQLVPLENAKEAKKLVPVAAKEAPSTEPKTSHKPRVIRRVKREASAVDAGVRTVPSRAEAGTAPTTLEPSMEALMDSRE